MRSNVVTKSLTSSVLLQLTVAVSGFILPHLIISIYGSQINGMISSITQFLSYLAMVESGIRASSLVELYKPLAEKNESKRNQILSATRAFYIKSGVAYLICLVGLMFLYPVFVKGQIDIATARWMILILASSNVVDYFILGKYQVLLAADQKTHIIYNIQSAGTLLNLIVSVVIIYFRGSILLVKFSGTLVYAFRSFFIILYVRSHYKNLAFNVKFKRKMLPQRWNALIHQIAGVVCNNTDLVLITILLGSKSLAEASVYYVYNLASTMFTSLFNSVSSAIIPHFGNLLSKGENELARERFGLFEFIYYIVIFTLYTCMFGLMIPFVKLYTGGAVDADYHRPILAILFVCMGVILNIRIPSMMIICAAGHYKQTQFRAIIEAVINLTSSIILILALGIEGAVIGTVCAFLYRSVDSIVYCAHNLMEGTLQRTAVRIIRNGILMIALCVGIRSHNLNIHSWWSFILIAIAMTVCTAIIFILYNVAFEWRNRIEFAKLLNNRRIGDI